MSRSKGSLATEFTVVTLGVALALGADSAAERFRERSLAFDALVAVQRDLKEDMEQLDENRLPRLDYLEGAQERLARHVGREVELQDSAAFLSDLIGITLYLTFDANTAAVEGLRNSGRLDLISNDELRAALLEYLNEVENVAEMDEQYRSVALESRSRLTPGLLQGARWRPTQDEEEMRRWAARALNGEALRNSDALREVLLVAEQLRWWQKRQYTSLRSDAQELADLLVKEIGPGS